jgi:ketosteroid isomerase-like protein
MADDQMVTMHAHLEIVERGIRYQAARDPRFFELCTDDVVLHYPVAHPPHPTKIAGKAAIAAFAASVGEVLPLLTVSDIKTELLGDGHSVLAQFFYTTEPGAAPAYQSRYCTIARFRDGLVCDYTMYFDASALP